MIGPKKPGHVIARENRTFLLRHCAGASRFPKVPPNTTQTHAKSKAGLNAPNAVMNVLTLVEIVERSFPPHITAICYENRTLFELCDYTGTLALLWLQIHALVLASMHTHPMHADNSKALFPRLPSYHYFTSYATYPFPPKHMLCMRTRDSAGQQYGDNRGEKDVR